MLAVHLLLPEHFVDAEPLDTATVMAGHIANKWYLHTKKKVKEQKLKIIAANNWNPIKNK